MLEDKHKIHDFWSKNNFLNSYLLLHLDDTGSKKEIDVY